MRQKKPLVDVTTPGHCVGEPRAHARVARLSTSEAPSSAFAKLTRALPWLFRPLYNQKTTHV
jgi:hypothetical protein